MREELEEQALAHGNRNWDDGKLEADEYSDQKSELQRSNSVGDRTLAGKNKQGGWRMTSKSHRSEPPVLSNA